MKIAVIGAHGQLGSDILNIFSKDKTLELFPLDHIDIDVADSLNSKAVLDLINPDLIINTAAFHKVEICEEEPEKSFLLNTFSPRNLALYAEQNDCAIMHFSSDYVFGINTNRKKPYTESDAPGPVNAYGVSKLAGEYFVRYLTRKHFVIRTTGLFGVAGSSGKGGNFVETMLKKSQDTEVRVVDDQVMTPTSTLDLARNLLLLIKTSQYGLYHMTSEGQCSWYEFAKEIFLQTKKNIRVVPISSGESNSPVKRPSYSVLENFELKKLGLNSMQDWKVSLSEYLKDKAYV